MRFINSAVKAIKNALSILSPSNLPELEEPLIKVIEPDEDPECGLPFVVVPDPPKPKIKRNPWYQTNNWRKMHGYPMRRNCGKRKH